MLGRATLLARSQAHAYLMLLRIEVTAFHPAALCTLTRTHSTEMAVPVHGLIPCPRHRLVSVALFLVVAAQAFTTDGC